MSYFISFSSPLTHLNFVKGVAVVSDKFVHAYWSTYCKGYVPTRSAILNKPDFNVTFKSLDDLAVSFLKMNVSIKFYDYEEL